ncbi:efflux RND transporter periplasmic adaptor subunit [Pontiella sulfatireligans]|uniref:Macrolide export protein MacA n=1 Tax=Pontiella sulfatireligans TaxID=2750658 RepID=A0A6C2UP18_9BACT|nr:HlyD family efflux transporter periplasmic adaptor subunit [Pontiella sulfatireligans]VGO21064.1 Macrolide export protein MacA [Pontiella sulfatireligans]
MKRKWMKLMVVVVLVGGAAGTAWVVRAQHGEHAPAYERVALERIRMEKTIEATAVVEPRNRIEIMPPLDGHIDEVLVDEGQEVKKGEIVAWMSSTERSTLLDAARARGTEMLEKWEDAYKATSLIAPLDGTIISRDTEPGQTVTTQDSVLVLSDRLVVSTQVDETDIGNVKVGQKVRITLDAYRNEEISGAVSRIAYEASTVNNVTIYEVQLEPDAIPDCMKSGMTATVAFILAEADDVLTLPVGAVGGEGDRRFVLVEHTGTDDPPERLPVQIGLSSGGRVEIQSGLQGDEVVVKTEFAVKHGKDGGSSPFVQAPPAGKRP